jgi:hypothetical protein|tara:strand:- start:2391 stop:2675 length:285 start_codon:yes stop_codon:yes gene_type:complete
MKKKVCPSRDKNEKFYFFLRRKLYNSIKTFSEIISNIFYKSPDMTTDFDYTVVKNILQYNNRSPHSSKGECEFSILRNEFKKGDRYSLGAFHYF